MHALEIFYLTHKKNFEYALWKIRQERYQTKKITKKNGGTRELNIPPTFTKIIQRKIASLLQEHYDPPKPVHGFIKSQDDFLKNIVSNATQHINKHIVINLDIANFFDEINFGRVRGLFLSKPFQISEHIATRLAQLTTHNNQLPQGAPTSPIISNLICTKLDHELIKVSKKYGLTYTRYADDLTFSSRKKNLTVESIISEIKEVIQSNGFSVNAAKTRVQTANQTQVVTGLKVNRKVNISRKYIKQIRSMLHSWHKDGLASATQKHFEHYNQQPDKYLSERENSFKNILIGKINFLGQVKGIDDPQYLKFRHTYFLLRYDFILKKKQDEFEELDINNLKKKNVLTTFIQIYDSILIFTEGETDITYIKSALEYFRNEGKFKNLKLRFCNLRGWANAVILHKVLYANLNEGKHLPILNIRRCILPHINDKNRFCFILDADEDAILGYFKHQKQDNYYLIDEDNKGYIEKLINQEIIIEIITTHGYEIDPKKAGNKTEKKLTKYLDGNNTSENIFSIDNYIVYKNKLIKKTVLASLISKREDVDYKNFESMFEFLLKMKHSHPYANKLCWNSIY